MPKTTYPLPVKAQPDGHFQQEWVAFLLKTIWFSRGRLQSGKSAF
jgi:hypothetical protein